jgi:hypothetical protein
MKQRRLISSSSPTQSPLTIPLLGALGSVLLHVMLLTPILWGGTAHKAHLPDLQAVISRAADSSKESTMTVVFVEEPDPDGKTGPTTAGIASLPAPSEILVPVAAPDLGPPPLALGQADSGEDDGHAAVPAGETDPGRALMLGRYLGQIAARVQRAWIRPRTSIASDLFACLVRISQERNGRVEEIEVVRCNGDLRWQTSLVTAVQSASPLPAPPDADVFSKVLTIEFTSEPITPGGSPEGFEPESRGCREQRDSRCEKPPHDR